MTRACVLLTWLLAGPSLASAQDEAPAAEDVRPARPPALTGRALVYLDAEEGVEEFLSIFVYEVVAGRLRDHGFSVVQDDSSDASQPALACLAREACAHERMRERSAPLVLAFHLAMQEERLVVTWRRSDAPGPEPLRVEGDEGEVAAALAQTLMALDPSAVPCLLTLESSLTARVTVDGSVASTPAVVEPGPHRASASAPGRAPWVGPLTCAGGRVLRIRIE